jgi:hypothetical protein
MGLPVHLPPSLFCKVSETRGLHDDGLQSSTIIGLIGKVAQTKELVGVRSDGTLWNQRLSAIITCKVADSLDLTRILSKSVMYEADR